jgi:hypothetical protein
MSVEIPNIIHQFYLPGQAEVPKRYEKNQLSWLNNYKNYFYRVWDEVSIEKFIKEKHYGYWPLYNSYNLKSQKVNMVKYLVLFHYGGIVADLQLEATVNFVITEGKGKEIILARRNKSADYTRRHARGEVDGKVLYHVSFMAGVARHPLWKACLRELYFQKFGKVLSTAENVADRSTGSVVLTRCYEGLELEETKDKVLILHRDKIDSGPFPNRTRAFIIEHKDSIRNYKTSLAIIVIVALIILIYVGVKTMFVNKTDTGYELGKINTASNK